MHFTSPVCVVGGLGNPRYASHCLRSIDVKLKGPGYSVKLSVDIAHPNTNQDATEQVQYLVRIRT